MMRACAFAVCTSVVISTGFFVISCKKQVQDMLVYSLDRVWVLVLESSPPLGSGIGTFVYSFDRVIVLDPRHVTVSSLSRPDTRSPLRPAAAVALAHLLVRSPMQADGYQQQYRVDGPELLIYQILVSLKRAAASSMGSCILEDSPSTLYLKRVMTASRKRCKQLVGSNGERWSQILRGARQESRWVAHREH
jgi:hypothetical protein